MDQSTAKRSSLFLLELIVAILFFALASAVCVQAYVGSRVKSREASDLTQAVLVCQNAAEVFYHAMDGTEAPLAAVAEGRPEYSLQGESLALYLDKDWNTCQKDTAAFRLTLELTDTGSLLRGMVRLHALAQNTELYSLPVARQTA